MFLYVFFGDISIQIFCLFFFLSCLYPYYGVLRVFYIKTFILLWTIKKELINELKAIYCLNKNMHQAAKGSK